ncbi:aspartate carbamoyltransferase regulatory subunit [Ferrimonas balearica]|uniref:aspartate carbamoyltransferase regulatory subunit n=1 Tax=Ferrimonas balearica TaxID=44012 RepID=UPI001C9929BA|nr:aspartate carbamoyltransferase regulatory subunit [Ferrimonas balearica]MBY5992433.1 aspartate carbamoyltransferase regulatory subunit [Ferrimonas balearica]
MTKDNKLQVEAIKNGSVIDHIPAHSGIKVLRLFQLHKSENRITIGLNLPSSAQGSKDLIKIENLFIGEELANQLALLAPNCTVNQIENYEVVRKLQLSLPEQVTGVFQCPNSNCITHSEPVQTRFTVASKGDSIKLKCHYCEKAFTRESMTERR